VNDGFHRRAVLSALAEASEPRRSCLWSDGHVGAPGSTLRPGSAQDLRHSQIDQQHRQRPGESDQAVIIIIDEFQPVGPW